MSHMKQFQSAALLLMIALLLPVRLPAADALLMTLQLDSNSVRWQDDFILSLKIYGAPSASPPELTIDGLDQFELRSQGKIYCRFLVEKR